MKTSILSVRGQVGKQAKIRRTAGNVERLDLIDWFSGVRDFATDETVEPILYAFGNSMEEFLAGLNSHPCPFAGKCRASRRDCTISQHTIRFADTCELLSGYRADIRKVSTRVDKLAVNEVVNF